MLLGINSYKPQDTFLHNFHPLVKFLTFFPVILLLFLKITISTQFFLLVLLFSVLAVSNLPLSYVKGLMSMYVVILVFFFFVGWLFQKSPGFWTNDTLASYRDVFGNEYQFRSAEYGRSHHQLENTHTTHITTEEGVNYGGFWGAEILKVGDQVKLFDSEKCLKTAAGLLTGDGACKEVSHQHNGVGSPSLASSPAVGEQYKNLNLRIFKIPHKGQEKLVGFFPTWYTITEFQVYSAFYFSNRIVLLSILSVLLTSSSSLFSISYALEDFFRPLKFFRLPTREMALIIFITLRFVFSLISESLRIVKAQASRGIDYKNGNFYDKLVSLVSLFVPLFFISFLKADELASSMKVRGYKPYETRSSFKRYKVVPVELLIFFVCTFCVTLLYFFFFNNYFVDALGRLEYLNKLV